ncbi:MAG: multicopper oxidase domain-containing protein, partial [Xanthomonadales bacterium]|nr:multicopper oxidase domain-containing protein [Xanthomonadales bacterium]
LQPVGEDELLVGGSEAAKTGVKPGSRRTRTLAYTGTGGTDFPVTYCPPGYTAANADMEDKLWTHWDGVEIMLPQLSGSMGIHPDFDLRFNPEPEPPRKFVAFDDKCPRMLLDSAEEWVVYNTSQTLWSHTDLERYPQPGAEPPFRYRSYPLGMAEGQKRFAEDPEFLITGKGNDHPFHIHVNPMWVLRIDVPDENGVLHNVLPDPCWMDSVAIPRNGGRIVFRSRFEDYTGQWINHCHILSHEDNGMMQMVECVDDPAKVNYRPRERVSTAAMSGPEVDAIYPRPSLELMYRQNISFVDSSHLGGYEFPGFEIDVPVLEAQKAKPDSR